MTGVTIDVDLRGTIDLAFGLHPDMKNAAVITGSSEIDRYWLARIKQELQLACIQVDANRSGGTAA